MPSSFSLISLKSHKSFHHLKKSHCLLELTILPRKASDKSDFLRLEQKKILITFKKPRKKLIKSRLAETFRIFQGWNQGSAVKPCINFERYRVLQFKLAIILFCWSLKNAKPQEIHGILRAMLMQVSRKEDKMFSWDF